MKNSHKTVFTGRFSEPERSKTQCAVIFNKQSNF